MTPYGPELTPDGPDPLGFEDLAPQCHPDHGCITCGDEGIPMRVLEADPVQGLALCVDGEGAESEVETALVGDLTAGETVLVHAAVALTRLEPAATP